MLISAPVIILSADCIWYLPASWEVVYYSILYVKPDLPQEFLSVLKRK